MRKRPRLLIQQAQAQSDNGEEGHMAGLEWLQRNDVGLGGTIVAERSSRGQRSGPPNVDLDHRMKDDWVAEDPLLADKPVGEVDRQPFWPLANRQLLTTLPMRKDFMLTPIHHLTVTTYFSITNYFIFRALRPTKESGPLI